MDRTVALALETPTPSMHLRLAPIGDAALEGDGPTRVFEPSDRPIGFSSQGPLCHGGGTESIIITTTAIDSEPAPVVVAEQAPPSLDELVDIDEDDVREVLEGRLELEPSRPGARTVRRDTVVTHPVPVGEGTQIVATVLVAPTPNDGTQIAATILREPARCDGTQIAATVLRAPTPVPPGVPIAIDTPPTSTPADITSVSLRVAGRYLGDAFDTSPVRHEIGSSLVLARTEGSPFENDPYVDAQHAALTFRPDGVALDDFDSTNGVFVRVQGKVALRSGDMFRLGEELLRYSAIKPLRAAGRAPAFGSPDPGYWGRIDVLLSPDDQAASYPMDDIETTLGQTEGHLQFPDDPFLAALHARVTKHERGASLEDLGSSSGTWLRLRSGDVVPYGSELLVGGTRVVLDRG